MSKVLVCYGTGTGCTAGVAERIGEVLAEAGAAVDVKPASEKPDASAYDAVVVGSGVRAGNWHAAAKEFVKSNARALESKPVAFFSVGLTITDASKADEVRAYTDPLIAESGVQPVDVGTFAGWNEPKSFSLPERMIMKVMKAPVGDFRDWDAIDAWTKSLEAKLGVA